MIASLPMYDMAPQQPVNDRFWAEIRSHLGYGPRALTRDGGFWEHWLHPELLLSQTCGYPYRARLHGKVALVGTPDYGMEGCPPGYYRSVFVARRDDPRAQLRDFEQARFAYNEPLSQSGWAAPMHHVRSVGLALGELLLTGGHAMSAQAVAEGRADIAALDQLSWVLFQRHEDFAGKLKEVEFTEATPALPFITALGQDPAPVFKAIDAAIGSMAPADRAALHLRGIVALSAEAYLAVPTPPAPA